MKHQIKNISDQNILSTIAENNLVPWGHFYDKYAPAMNGIKHNLRDERTLAEKIFKEVFLQLKEKQIPSKVSHSLDPYLLSRTCHFERGQLSQRGRTCSNSPIEETALINIICSQDLSFKEAASNFNITEEEVNKTLSSIFKTPFTKQVRKIKPA